MSCATDVFIIPDEDDPMSACTSTVNANRRKSTRRSLLIIADRSATSSPRCFSSPISSLNQHANINHVQPTTESTNVNVTPSATTIEHLAEKRLKTYNDEMEKWRQMVTHYNARSKLSTIADVDITADWIMRDRIVSRYRDILHPDSDFCAINTDSIENLRNDIMYELICVPNILQRHSSFLSSLHRKALMSWKLTDSPQDMNRDFNSLLVDIMNSSITDC